MRTIRKYEDPQQQLASPNMSSVFKINFDHLELTSFLHTFPGVFSPALSGVLEVSWAGPTGAVIGSFDIASDLLTSCCDLSFPQLIPPDEFLCLLRAHSAQPGKV